MLFVLTGPESCGKSVLAEQLAEYFGVSAVKEIARTYLAGRAGYLPSDLLEIAQQQISAEAQVKTQIEGETGSDLAFADTDLQVLYIWWQERFGPVPDALRLAYAQQSARFYLLCRPDIEWSPDPLRENPHDRARLFELYQQDLQQRNLPYAVVEGQGEVRLQCAIQVVKASLGEQA